MSGGTVALVIVGAAGVGVGGYFLLRRRPAPVGISAVGAYIDPKMQQAQRMVVASPRAASSPSLLGQLENRAWSAVGSAADKVVPGLGGAAVSAGKSLAKVGGKAIAKGLKKLKFW